MPSKRATKVGKIMPYVDVRSEKQIPQFESLLKVGPVVVLVYADWCGHCQTFKQKMWDDVAPVENKAVNTAAVHYNMVDKTSIKNASIKGYPTLIEVSPTPKANVTNVIKTPQNKAELKTLVGVEEVEEEEDPSVATMNANGSMDPSMNTMNAKMNMNANRSMDPSMNTMNANMFGNVNASMKKRATNLPILTPRENTFTPASARTLPPPDPSADAVTTLVESQRPSMGMGMKGGNLMGSLLKVIEDTGHIALLAASASELHKRFGKKHKHTRKSRHAKRKTLRRRR